MHTILKKLSLKNVIPILFACISIVGYFLSDVLGTGHSLTDTVIKTKIRSISKGKEPTVIETPLTVNKNSFAVGKELRDILWPTSCVVLSFKHAKDNPNHVGIAEEDVITVRYKTYNPVATAEKFECIVGEQSDHINSLMNPQL